VKNAEGGKGYSESSPFENKHHFSLSKLTLHFTHKEVRFAIHNGIKTETDACSNAEPRSQIPASFSFAEAFATANMVKIEPFEVEQVSKISAC